MGEESKFPFEILTLQKQFLQQEIHFVIAPGQEGQFEVLAHHAPFVFALKPGALRMRLPDGKDQYVVVGTGFLVVQKDRTTVLTRSAEKPEKEIDKARAQRSKERAERRLLAEKAVNVDTARAQAALQRALARLKIAEYSIPVDEQDFTRLEPAPTSKQGLAAHVHSWEKAKERGHPLAAGNFSVHHDLSREFGCEGTLLAHRLEEILNERCRPFFTWVAYDQQLIEQVANELHLAHGVVESIDGHRRNEMSEFFETILNKRVNETVVIRKIAEVIRSLAIHGHTIFVGRGSYLITQDLKTGMHIRLIAPLEWRIRRIAVDRKLSIKEAEQAVLDGERERQHYIETFFSGDAARHFLPDITIDNSRFNLAQLSEIVFTALGARFTARRW